MEKAKSFTGLAPSIVAFLFSQVIFPEFWEAAVLFWDLIKVLEFHNGAGIIK
jgi:hypothetical protein|tara:strand:- start:490 stop:645 length:156 start_codon:yes stop_codon:yes gene_type:complete